MMWVLDNVTSSTIPQNITWGSPNEVERLDIKPGWLALTVIMMTACLATNFLLIYIIISRKHLRCQPSKWLLVNLSACILMKGLLLVSRQHLSKSGLPDWSNVSNLCVPLDIIHTLKVFMVPIATLLVSIERFRLLLNSTNQHSGFGPKVTIALLVIGWSFAVGFTLITILALGHFEHQQINGKLTCMIHFTPASIYMFLLAFIIISLAILGLTIAIVCGYFKRAATPYQRDNVVIASAVPNFIYCTLKLSTYGLYFIYYTFGTGGTALAVMFDVYFTYIFLIPLCWVLASCELRSEARKMLCPLWTQFEDNADENIILSEDQTSVHSAYVINSSHH